MALARFPMSQLSQSEVVNSHREFQLLLQMKNPVIELTGSIRLHYESKVHRVDARLSRRVASPSIRYRRISADLGVAKALNGKASERSQRPSR